MTTNDSNTADNSKEVFRRLMVKCSSLGIESAELSEADTRSKFIDPIFRECLGWPESEITREDPVAEGYADYTFGGEFKWFHVEAKRTLPRFTLHIPSRKRRLNLSGAHLLGNKSLKPLIEQAAGSRPARDAGVNK